MRGRMERTAKPERPQVVMSTGLLSLIPLCLGAASPLSEAEVIRLARARTAAVRAAEAAVEVQAAAADAATYPNPQAFWNRQHIPGSGPGSESEDALGLSIPLNPAGALRARRGMARSRAAGAESQEHRVRSSSVRLALDTYYEGVYSQSRAAIAAGQLARVEEATRVVARRMEEGTSSGLDEARLQLELDLARADRERYRLEAAARRAELSARLELDLPVVLPSSLQLASSSSTTKEGWPLSLRRAELAVEEARRAGADAEWSWIPTISVSGGLFIRNSGEPSYGYLAGISLPLPLFSRGQGLRALAAAQTRLSQARADALKQELRAQRRAAEVRLERARRELERFESSVGTHAERVRRAAHRAYEEGRSTVVEFVDALRIGDRVRLRRLDLEWMAKQAELQLREARGEFE